SVFVIRDDKEFENAFEQYVKNGEPRKIVGLVSHGTKHPQYFNSQKISTIKRLVPKDTCSNIIRRCIVEWASANGYLELVKYIMDTETEEVLREMYLKNSLNLSVGWGHLEVVRYCVKKDAGININNFTVLHYALINRR